MTKIQLSIPEPCHENWDNMTPTQQGRYCNACAKEVIDFSNMSDSEVLSYFLRKKKADTVCGRAFPDQLEREMRVLPKKKKHWQWYYMLSAFLFFMKPAKTKAQGKVIMRSDTTNPVQAVKFEGGEEKSKTNFVKAVVTDAAGKPVPFASVKIIGTDRGTGANEEGKFELFIENSQMKIEISALGYETKIIAANRLINQIILERRVEALHEVVVSTTICRLSRRHVAGAMSVKGTMIATVKEKKSLTDTIKNWLLPLQADIKIYPNPVTRGSSFTISMKLRETGNLTIQITDAGGRLMTEKKITTSVKEWKEPFATGNAWSGGVYYVTIINDQGMLVYTGSLVVQ